MIQRKLSDLILTPKPAPKRSYIIPTPAQTSLEARWGGSWQLVKHLPIAGLTPLLLMNDFRPGIGCCTLTALTAVFSQLRRDQKFSAIPIDPQHLFSQIEAIAARHGYKPDRGRTNPLRIGAIIRACFRAWSLSGRAGSSIVSPAKIIRREIDAGRPVLLNIACGSYRRHTVVISGYEIWHNSQQSVKNRHALHSAKNQRLIWIVQDGWNREEQLIDHHLISRPWSGSWSVFSYTRIRPEKIPLAT